MKTEVRWNPFSAAAVALILLVAVACTPPVAMEEPTTGPTSTESWPTDTPSAPASSPTATEFQPTDTPSAPADPESEREETLSVPPPPTEQVGDDQGEVGGLVAIARSDLARRLGMPEAGITVQSVEEVMWPNAGLDCPQPGFEYAQVITPGYKILLRASGRTYSYHANPRSLILLCTKGVPEVPIILLEKGEETKDNTP
jgi:hypothetical protein